MAFTILIMTSLQVKAQVSIGSLSEPQKGELLELKTIEVTNPASLTDPSNETVGTTGGGLGLPRVRLIDRNTLEPFINSNSPEWTDNAKLTHAGMVVYNISVSDSTEKRANKIFSLGLYVWNGSEWSKITDHKNDKKFFYMPSFRIELSKTGPDSFNLYDEYVRQFTKNSNPANNMFVSSNTNANFVNIPTHESGRLYTYNELDFVVTYYDKSIMTIDKIDTNGLMHYTITDLNLSEKSYINVVLVVR
jgi:hypothetical protein